MKIEKKGMEKVFAKDVDYGAVVLINSQYYMPIKKESFEELFMLPFINLESGKIKFFPRMEEASEVKAKLVID